MEKDPMLPRIFNRPVPAKANPDYFIQNTSGSMELAFLNETLLYKKKKKEREE